MHSGRMLKMVVVLYFKGDVTDGRVMKNKRLLQRTSRYSLILFIFVLFAQHAGLCMNAWAAPSAGGERSYLSNYGDDEPSQTETQSRGGECDHPCHLTSMKAPDFVLNRSINPDISHPFQDVFSPKGVIDPIFHPPRIV
ncbi:MAG: hypothetical protein ACE5J1_00995 [Nitrospiria bacterium]